jgi:branched-chain amino acid transport system permease protein
MLGGYGFYFISKLTGLASIPAVFASMLCVFILGILFEASFLRPIHKDEVERPAEYAILITFGLAFFLQNMALAIFGAFPKTPPSFLPGAVRIGALAISKDRLVADVISIATIAALIIFLNKTWTGKALRAVSEDKDAAAAIGVNPYRFNNIAFGVGTALAAGAGAIIAPIFSVIPTVGIEPGIRCFVIIVLGGMGSIRGAVIGGIIIGIVESIGSGLFLDMTRGLAYKPVFGLLIFVIILLFRPTGLFGQKS